MAKADALKPDSQHIDPTITAAEHVAHAHAHAMAAGEHANMAATHLQAAVDAAGHDANSDQDTTVKPGGRSAAGFAQNRTGFAAGSGAARAYSQARSRRS